MLCRQIVFSIAKKRCFQCGVQASSIACGYVEKFNNTNNLGHSINYNDINKRQHNLKVIKRFKYNKKQPERDENEESDSEDEDDISSDKTQTVTSVKVNSLRADTVLKSGLNIARNKIETAFYESKIRVNGRKIFKKSEQLRIGDEVDLIRGPSPTNPNFILVSRVHLLSVKENSDSYTVKLAKNKSLVIENYDEPWNTPST